MTRIRDKRVSQGRWRPIEMEICRGFESLCVKRELLLPCESVAKFSMNIKISTSLEIPHDLIKDRGIDIIIRQCEGTC